jgi:choline dehydrogenase-like flavoprotein
MTFIDDVAAVTFEDDDDSVVGSGAGGGTLANELSEKGIDVVVLEAGPRFRLADFRNGYSANLAQITLARGLRVASALRF